MANTKKIFNQIRYYLINLLLNMNHDSSGAFRCYNAQRIKLNDLLKAKNNGYSFLGKFISIKQNIRLKK